MHEYCLPPQSEKYRPYPKIYNPSIHIATSDTPPLLPIYTRCIYLLSIPWMDDGMRRRSSRTPMGDDSLAVITSYQVTTFWLHAPLLEGDVIWCLLLVPSSYVLTSYTVKVYSRSIFHPCLLALSIQEEIERLQKELATIQAAQSVSEKRCRDVVSRFD